MSFFQSSVLRSLDSIHLFSLVKLVSLILWVVCVHGCERAHLTQCVCISGRVCVRSSMCVWHDGSLSLSWVLRLRAESALVSLSHPRKSDGKGGGEISLFIPEKREVSTQDRGMMGKGRMAVYSQFSTVSSVIDCNEGETTDEEECFRAISFLLTLSIHIPL